MKKRNIIIAALLLVSLVSVSQNKIKTPLVLDTRLELFVDSFLIGSLDNLQLRMHAPVDEGPVLRFDKPWAGPFSA